MLLYGSGAERSTFGAEQYLADPAEWSWERSGSVSCCSMVVGESGAQQSSFEVEQYLAAPAEQIWERSGSVVLLQYIRSVTSMEQQDTAPAPMEKQNTAPLPNCSQLNSARAARYCFDPKRSGVKRSVQEQFRSGAVAAPEQNAPASHP